MMGKAMLHLAPPTAGSRWRGPPKRPGHRHPLAFELSSSRDKRGEIKSTVSDMLRFQKNFSQPARVAKASPDTLAISRDLEAH